MGSVDTKKIAKLLIDRRKELKLTRMELARRAGVPRRTLINIENEIRCYVLDPDRMVGLANVLDITVSSLLDAFGFYEPKFGFIWLKSKYEGILSWLRRCSRSRKSRW